MHRGRPKELRIEQKKNNSTKTDLTDTLGGGGTRTEFGSALEVLDVPFFVGNNDECGLSV